MMLLTRPMRPASSRSASPAWCSARSWYDGFTAGDPALGWAGSPGEHGSGRRHDDVLDLGHVAVGGRRGVVGGTSALPGVQVRRVPVPPVVRRGGPLVLIVALGRLVQQIGQRGDVHVSPPTPGRGAGS